MWEHAVETTKKIFAAAGGEIWETNRPDPAGTSLHETSTARITSSA